MKITTTKHGEYYLALVEGIYERFGREGLSRLINVVEVLNDIEIKQNEHVDKNRKRT